MNRKGAIKARKPAVGNGITDAKFPLATFVNDLPSMRRISMVLWSRWNNQEDLRDITKRMVRYFGKESVPTRKDWSRDSAGDAIDLVVTVAGILWPGLSVWQASRVGKGGEYPGMIDLWWGTWGHAPGAVILNKGVIHLVHMDADTEEMMESKWVQYIRQNWRGHVLHHAIQVQGDDPTGDESQIVNKLAKGGNRGGCILWPTSKGLDLRPWRADIGGFQLLTSPLGEGFRVGTLSSVALSIRKEMRKISTFWEWLDGMKVPDHSQVLTPQNSHFELQRPSQPKWGKSGAKKNQDHAPEQTPLFEEVLAPSDDITTPASREFGERITPEVGIERLVAMRDAAKSGLVQANISQSRKKIEYWTEILTEIQACLDSATKSVLHPPMPAPLLPHK